MEMNEMEKSWRFSQLFSCKRMVKWCGGQRGCADVSLALTPPCQVRRELVLIPLSRALRTRPPS